MAGSTPTGSLPGCWLKQLIKGGLNKQIHSLLLPHCLKVRFQQQPWVLETVPLSFLHLSSCEGKCRCAKGRWLHCSGTQPIDHAGNPETPLHADTGQAALGPLQPHIQVPPGLARRVGQTLTQTVANTDSNILLLPSLPRILSFPRNHLSPEETRQGLAAAFRMWSDVSPFSFREVAPERPSDLKIGG